MNIYILCLNEQYLVYIHCGLCLLVFVQAGSTQLRQTVDFNANTFSKEIGAPLIRKVYDNYGSNKRNNLSSIVTGTMLAKMCPKGTGSEKRGKRGKKSGKANKMGKINKRPTAGPSFKQQQMGFKIVNIKSMNVVQVRTLKGMDKKEVAFGQVTCNAELWLVPVNFNSKKDAVPFEPPFSIQPDPGRWRRAVNDKAQVS